MTSFNAPDPWNSMMQSSVPAVDPVTLRRATELCPNSSRPIALAGQVSPVLARMGVVREHEGHVDALLDLTSLEWPLTARPGEMHSYLGEIRHACQFRDIPVTYVDGHVLVALPMRAPGGEEVTLWMYELDDDPGLQIDLFALVHRARELRRRWDPSRCRRAEVAIPVLGFIAAGEMYGLGVPTFQEISVRLQPDGEDASWATPSAEVIVGARGPVLGWFTGKRADLPAAVFVTRGDQWERPGDRPHIERQQGNHWLSCSAPYGPEQVRTALDRVEDGQAEEWFREHAAYDVPDVIWEGVMAAKQLTGPDFHYTGNIRPIIDRPIGEATWRDLATWFTWQSRGEYFGYGHILSELENGRLPALFARFLRVWEESTTSPSRTSTPEPPSP